MTKHQLFHLGLMTPKMMSKEKLAQAINVRKGELMEAMRMSKGS